MFTVADPNHLKKGDFNQCSHLPYIPEGGHAILEEPYPRTCYLRALNAAHRVHACKSVLESGKNRKSNAQYLLWVTESS